MKSQTIYMTETSRLQALISFISTITLSSSKKKQEKKQQSFQLSLYSVANLRRVQSLILWHLFFHPLPPFFNSPPSIHPFLSPPFVIRGFGENITPVQGAVAHQGGVFGVSRNKITKGLSAIKTLSKPQSNLGWCQRYGQNRNILKCSVHHLFFKVALTLMGDDGSFWQLIGWIVCASTGLLSLLSEINEQESQKTIKKIQEEKRKDLIVFSRAHFLKSIKEATLKYLTKKKKKQKYFLIW